jgi:hypothetical protein
MTYEKWTSEEIAILRFIYAQNKGKRSGWLKRLAKHLHRTIPSITKKAVSLGLTEKNRLPTKAVNRKISLTRQRHNRSKPKNNHNVLRPFTTAQESLGLICHSSEGLNAISAAQSDRLRSDPDSIHASVRKGRRDDLGDTFFRSSWEANYARFLNYSHIKWQYEPKTFWFESVKSGNRRYTPDFYLPETDEYIEIKGWMDPKSQTKLNRMAKLYSEIKITVVDREFFNDAERQGLCRLIPHWECRHNKEGQADAVNA